MPEFKRGLGLFLVAIDMDGVCSVHQGCWKKGKLRAIGINIEPYAWAYMPNAPDLNKIRYRMEKQ